ncbi:hypothetical protein TYRP_011602 [Tyrophagus putrescentiae]|nr:hypothetical protein TYRP_011602 [Tyrophagus putrescentiae]
MQLLRRIVLTALDDLFIPDEANGEKVPIHKTGRLVQGGHQKDRRHRLDHPRHGAPAASQAEVAHVDVPAKKKLPIINHLSTTYQQLINSYNTSKSEVPLSGKEQRQPDGVGVKERGEHLVHDVKEVAGARRVERVGRAAVVAQRVQVEVPGGGREEGEQVGDGHRQQHQIGRCAHVRLAEDQYDEEVGDERGHEEKWEDVAEEGHAQVLRDVAADVQQEGLMLTN